MHHQNPGSDNGVIVSYEVRHIRRGKSYVAGFDRLRGLPLDFERHSSVEPVDDFLRAGVHVPRSSSTRLKFYDGHHGLLNLICLPQKIAPQELRRFRPRLVVPPLRARGLGDYGFCRNSDRKNRSDLDGCPA